jgi:type VI secretion system protein ImpE
MDKAYSLYLQAQLRAAIAELGGQLRREPQNSRARTFLFELLCFAGEFDRAETQLDVLAAQNKASGTGAAFYHDLLVAHRQREALLEKKSLCRTDQIETHVMQVNGITYESCVDADARVDGGLETYGAAGYGVTAWEKIQRLEIQKPVRLRDLLWIPARLLLRETGVAGTEPFPVYLPALAPGTWRHSDDNIRLGKSAVLEEGPDSQLTAFGAKLLLCDEETIPLLDVRTLEVEP